MQPFSLLILLYFLLNKGRKWHFKAGGGVEKKLKEI
jgi:hypothetical protein